MKKGKIDYKRTAQEITAILNYKYPWRYSLEEPRPTEVFAARWQYRGPYGYQSAYPSTLISVFLTGFRYFSYQVATQLSSRGWVDPFQTLYFQKNF